VPQLKPKPNFADSLDMAQERSALPNRLTISDDIQLFFRPDGSAWYASQSGKLPEQMEQIVYEWQDDNLDHLQFDFSEQWLQAYEAPDRRKDEVLRELRSAYERFRKYMLRTLLDAGVPKSTADERVRRMVEVVMTEHNAELLADSEAEE
jgi:hypothetical protein